MPPALFALVILEIEFCFLPKLACTMTLLSRLPAAAGMTDMHHHTQLVFH
jgi:hypothetical protein